VNHVPESRFFVYRNGILHAEGVDLPSIAREVGSPSYVYSWNAIRQAYASVDQALQHTKHQICYAVKANGNLAILRRLGKLGCGADIVSGGELVRAREAGIPPERIVFSGVGKTDAEIESALALGVRSLHVESPAEIDAIEAVAARMGVVAAIALRVNPDVDPRTHPYIATGLKKSKFGIAMDHARALLPRVLESRHLKLEGLACHIGSLIGGSAAMRDAVEAVARLALEFKGRGAPIATLDAGGGWPIAYGDEASEPEPYAAFGAAIAQGIARAGAADAGFELIVEPGRCIVGDAGVLLTQVIFVKEQSEKRFVIVDAAMTELIRPALYDAYHAIVPVRAAHAGAQLTPADVVGPVCESGDFLALDRPLPPLARGDLLAIRGAGAYGASMGSHYNSRPRAAEVLVDGSEFHLVRRREKVEDLFRDESMK
jgi:diaminopimelate decarboxylase